MHHVNRTTNKINCTGAQRKHTTILTSHHHKSHLFRAHLYKVMEKFPRSGTIFTAEKLSYCSLYGSGLLSLASRADISSKIWSACG